MLNRCITALSLVIALGFASRATAAPRHQFYHQIVPSVEQQFPPSTLPYYYSNPPHAPGFGNEPDYMAIQDQDLRESD